MRKKVLVFLSVIGMCLFGLFNNSVYAQEEAVFPNVLTVLRYRRYFPDEFVDNPLTIEHVIEYSLPYQIYDDYGDLDYILVHQFSSVCLFYKGEIRRDANSYKLEEVLVEGNETRFRFRITVLKPAAGGCVPFVEGSLTPFFRDYSKMYVKFDNTDYVKAVLRDYFYRIPSEKRPENLYQVGMPYDSGVAYAGRMYWTLQHYIDIRDYLDTYNMFLSYTSVPNAYLQALYFYDVNKNMVAYVQVTDELEQHVFKFENEERYVVGMLHFKDTDTGNYVDWSKVKYMRFTYHTTPYPDSQVLITLTNTLDISIGEYWRVAEVFNTYYQAGYEEGFNVGFGRGQDLYSDEILEMLEKEFERGYREGYNRGMSEDFDVFSYFEALFGEQGLGRLLRLELLPGVSLGAVIMIPLAFWLVSFIMRWFR